MPYIANHSELLKVIKKIPNAETAKMAIVRPTKHFKILTGDNPYMEQTLKHQKTMVAHQLKFFNKFTADAKKKIKKHLINEYQQNLSLEAYKEQLGLVAQFSKHNIPISMMLEDKGRFASNKYDYYTDQIFATDTGQYYDHNGSLEFIPAQFKNKQRQGEERLAIAQAKNLGAVVKTLFTKGEKLFFEGGDIRQMPGKKLFFIGQGHRSSAKTAKAIAENSEYYVLPIVLKQPNFYHLDCCFLPLPNDAAVIYEGEYVTNNGSKVLDENGWPKLIAGTETMAPESRAIIRSIYQQDKLVLISKDEALAFATNAAIFQSMKDGRFKMFVNGNRNLKSAFPNEHKAIQTQQISYTAESIKNIIKVTNHLMDIIEVPYSTMHKSGGSVRCTVQEVACSSAAINPNKPFSYYFSQKLDEISQQCRTLTPFC